MVSLDGDFQQCVTCIDGLKSQLSHVSMLGNVFTLVGAAMAAIGSVVAGASKGGKQSWIAGFVGVAGAIVVALPKTLPDRADIQRRISLADQHRVSGEKTMRQLSLISDAAAVTEGEKYAIARFIDCSAAEPAKDVPEPPTSSSGAALVVAAAEQAAKAPRPTGAGASAPAVARPAAAGREALHGQPVAAVLEPQPHSIPAAPAPLPRAAHAPPPNIPASQPAQALWTREECEQLPAEPPESLRGRCIACISQPGSHSFKPSAPFGQRCWNHKQ